MGTDQSKSASYMFFQNIKTKKDKFKKTLKEDHRRQTIMTRETNRDYFNGENQTWQEFAAGLM